MPSDDLNYRPPTADIPLSSYGEYVEDGIHPVRITGWRENPNSPGNAWVDAELTDGDQKGELYSMNVYLPTNRNLNEKAKEKGSKEEALKSFFHYRQTLEAAGVPLTLPIGESLDKLKGWEGKALFVNEKGYRTNIQKLIPAQAPVEAAASGEPF